MVNTFDPVLLVAVLIYNQQVIYTYLYFLKGQDVDTTQTFTSTASEPSRASKICFFTVY